MANRKLHDRRAIALSVTRATVQCPPRTPAPYVPLYARPCTTNLGVLLRAAGVNRATVASAK